MKTMKVRNEISDNNVRPKRGRPSNHDPQLIKRIIRKYRGVIVVNKHVISKKCEQWTEIAREITAESGKFISPGALYTIAMKNTYGVFDSQEMIATSPQTIGVIGNDKEDNYAEVSNTSGSSMETSINGTTVDITFDKRELEDLIICKQYGRSERSRPQIPFRKYYVLEPGKWQLAVTEKLWEANKTTCGYGFKRNKIYNGIIELQGKCACGSVFNGTIIDYQPNNTLHVMRCEMSKGNGICGKRYLRNPERREIGKILCEGDVAAEVYRTKKANQLMDVGDPEPPQLYNAKTLRAAKKEYIESNCFDKNAILSLECAQQSSTYKYSIHNIGLSPFYVHYWTNHQVNLYREYALKNISSISIDATGSVVRKVLKPSKAPCKHIFLYLIVMNNPGHEKITLAQMLSESQTTNAIKSWLCEWVQAGAPTPKEVTCDSSVALLSAVIQTFTTCKTIDNYAESCWGEPTQSCYVRIDVAHFIKGYANFLSSQNRRVKEFYLACLGQLILATSLDQAEDILTSILVIALSETEGNSTNDEPTLCEKQKLKMKLILTTLPNESDSSTDILKEKVDLDLNVCSATNSWKLWGDSIHDNITDELDDTGDRENAHYLPSLATRILRDIKWYPLWSCICVEKFGYGRIPASSAAVEANNNIIKNQLFSRQELPTRPDLFVMKHLDYIDGRVKIAKAKAVLEKDAAKKENISPVHPNLVKKIGMKANEEQLVRNREEEFNDIHENSARMENEQLHGQIRSASETKCPVCRNGDLPSSAHSCAICKTFVHALDLCSAAIEGEEEGYGQKRICSSCQNLPSDIVKNILECATVENWRGLSEPPKNKSRYLRKYHPNLQLTETKLSKVPILKNGSCGGLRFINLNGKKISVIRTCGYDSIFQIFLTAMLDSVEFKNAVATHADDSKLFQSLTDTLKTGINRSTYIKRAQILTEIFEGKVDPYNCEIYDCKVSAGHLGSQLFGNCCSLEETTVCNGNCEPRLKKFPVIGLQKSSIWENDFSLAVESSFRIFNSRKCGQADCQGTSITEISYTGPFRILKVWEFDAVTRNAELHEIPIQIKMSFMTTTYSLKGLIHLIPPAMKRRSNEESSGVGHFTAIVRRKDGSWIEYDDTKSAETKLSKKFKPNIQLLIYGI